MNSSISQPVPTYKTFNVKLSEESGNLKQLLSVPEYSLHGTGEGLSLSQKNSKIGMYHGVSEDLVFGATAAPFLVQVDFHLHRPHSGSDRRSLVIGNAFGVLERWYVNQEGTNSLDALGVGIGSTDFTSSSISVEVIMSYAATGATGAQISGFLRVGVLFGFEVNPI